MAFRVENIESQMFFSNHTNIRTQKPSDKLGLFGYGFTESSEEPVKTMKKNGIGTDFKVEKSYTDRNDYKYFVGKDNNGNTVIRRDFQGLNSSDEKTGMFDTEEVRSNDGTLISFTTRVYTENKEENYFAKHCFDKYGNETKVICTLADKNGNIISKKEMTPQEYGDYDQEEIEMCKRGKFQGKEHILPVADENVYYIPMNK